MRYVMATGIMEIQTLKIWHVVRAYHRCALLSVPSESIAETVGFVLRDAATKAAGHPKSVDVFVRAAHIRLVGLLCHGGEEGVLSDALNLYFNARSPEKWHFKTSKAGPAVVAKRVDVERAIRQQELPCWVALPLRQAAGRIRHDLVEIFAETNRFVFDERWTEKVGLWQQCIRHDTQKAAR